MSTPMKAVHDLRMTRAEAEDLLFREARLLDQLRLDEWLKMYTPDGIYWMPIDENAPVSRQGALIYDTPMRRQERVYHQLHTPFPAQTPRSRMLHVVSNVIVEPAADSVTVQSSQVIYEMRTGDFSQVGLGDIRTLAASVEHVVKPHEGEMKIAQKKILLINRDAWHGNMTFII
jgi:ethylbenzene dioxygenase subunit beta